MDGNRKIGGMLGLALAFALAGGSLSIAFMENSRKESQEVLLNANSLIGNSVIDQAGHSLGTVKDLLIDQGSGEIAYIVLAYGGTFGGTLGINQEKYSIPWKEVSLTKKDEEMVIQVARLPVKKTPSTHHTQERNVSDQFDSSNIQTVVGTVNNIDYEMFEEKVNISDRLVVLDLQTASGKARVRVAPKEYLNHNKFTIEEGEKIKVTGSPVTQKGENVLLASSLTLSRTGQVLELRNTDGTPKWNLEGDINTKSKSNN